MNILIAESKSMQSLLEPRSMHPAATSPVYLEEAEIIMASVAGMTAPEVAGMLHSSGKLGLTAIELAKAFGHTDLCLRAIDAFTGVVFRSLDAPTLDPEASNALCSDVKIVSSVYGLLRPDDAILSYRLDLSAKVPGMAGTLKQFWKPKLTVYAGKYLKENPENEMLFILPSDALGCFDLKLLRGLGNVGILELRTYNDEGRLTTPRAERLKNRRGLFLRQILERGITSLEELEHFSSPDFEYLGQEPYPGRYSFLC